jgi:hypothetical protein
VSDDRREEFMAWMFGWRDGASARAKRQAFVDREDRKDLTAAYLEGYAKGHEALCEASKDASRRYRYLPSVLREEAAT